MKFKSVIKIIGFNPYILISKFQATKLKHGWKKPMPVLIRINNQPKNYWRINMMPIGDGRFYLYLAGVVRKASKTKVGDKVSVEVKFDDKYKNGPMHRMPEWFLRPLNKNSKAKMAWQALIPSRKKEILRYLSWLKSKEARDRNVAKAIDVLSGKKGRYMARTWN